MDFILARQPIFTTNRKVFAYELLYRGSASTSLDEIGGDKATTSLLTSVFLTEGIEKISNHRPCFINFTRELLARKIPLTFSPRQVIVEVLEDVPPDPDILANCRTLKEKGYTIALDDFVYHRELEPIIGLADIIKFDFRLSTLDDIMRTMRRLSRHKLHYLAEKIETVEEFDRAAKLGFSYYQGFFFSRPETLKIRELTAVKLSLVQMLTELSRTDWSVDELSAIITRDVSLTYKILRYINSSYFYRLHRIESVAHAISYLGENEIRRFAILAIISEIAANKPEELVNLALFRGRFCELLAEKSAQQKNSRDIFILGLFSLLDAMLDMKMADILRQLPLAPDLYKGLAGGGGPYGPYLQFVRAYERRDKKTCLDTLKTIGGVTGRIHEYYLQAISFAHSVLSA